MERLIAIENFFIIKVPQFNEIIQKFNLNLTTNDSVYLLTLILINIFAYLVIYIFIKLVLRITAKLFRRRKRVFY